MKTIAAIIGRALEHGRRQLNEIEAKRVLELAGVPVTDTCPAKSRDEAIAIAGQLGYPVALKIVSAEIVHKSDIGGVRLGLENPAAVGVAFDEIVAAAASARPDCVIDGVCVQKMAAPGVEVIIGMSRDPQFGPVIMFGLGGVWVEIYKDVTMRIAPITGHDAREMISEIKGRQLLEGYRGLAPVNIEALTEILLSVSALAVDNPVISELDINPVIAGRDAAIAVDAQLTLK